MSFPGFFAWPAAWLLFLIPPLVLFYFLKLKRPRLQIPSLVLWQQVLNDNRVNSPFQRFKRNILLLLQLLLLVLLILAAMQPYWRGDADRVKRLGVLIDCSASMAALDKPGGRSRLAQAKEKVGELIDGMLPDQTMSLIAFGRSARRLTSFTANKRVLRDALASVKIQDVASDIEDALRMTQALSQRTPFEQVLLFSDGNFPTKTNFELSFALDYQRLEGAGANMGITTLNAKHAGPGQWELFVKVESSSDTTTSASVELLLDGVVINTEDIALDKQAGQRLVFPLATTKETSVQVRLKPDGFDSLASDNFAYLDLAAARPTQVYTPADMLGHRSALGAIEGVELFAEQGKDTTSQASFDLIISDDSKDVNLDAQVAMYISVIPEDLTDLVTIQKEQTEVVDWQRNDLILQHVTLSDLVILESPHSNQDITEGDYENRGYEVVAHGRHGPLLLKKRDGGRISYYMLFHTDNSTLPYRVGFPVMLHNLVNLARHEAGLLEQQGNRTGVLPPIAHLNPGENYRIKGPDGHERVEKTDDAGILTGVPAPRVGEYKISRGGSVVRTVGVSLVDSHETSLAGVEKIQFSELTVAAAATPIKMDHSFWATLAALALIMLMIEWWFYQHRPGGVRA